AYKTSAGATVWTRRADPVADESQALAASLLSRASSSTGAGLVGYSDAVVYTNPLIGQVVRSLPTSVHAYPYNATGNGAADDSTAIQAAIDAVSARGSGIVYLAGGKTYVCTVAPVVKDRVILDLQGATLSLTLSGATSEGVKLRNYAGVQNGTIAVASTGSPGSQGGIHAPITIGPLYGNGGTVASPSVDEGVQGWFCRNLTLSTDRAGKMGIAIIGGAHNGTIENITIPDSSTIGVGIGLDWGYLGTLVTSSDAGIVAGRVAFDAGTTLTTHPHNIRIRGVRMGLLTYATSHGVRLSGVHGITVEDVEIGQTNYAGFYHTAGDAGYEFAAAAVKPSRHKGIRVRNLNVLNANNGWGGYVDCYADNVASAITNLAYSPFLAAIQEIDIVLEQCRTKGSGGGSAMAGFRAQQLRGGRFIDCEATGHDHGAHIEIAAEDVQVIRGRYYSNTKNGVFMDNGTTKPVLCRAIDVEAYSNGATYAGIQLGNSIRCVAKGSKLGRASGETQTNGVKVGASGACVAADVQDNYSYGVAGGGVHYVCGSTTDYACLDVFADNDHGSGTSYSGVDIVPYSKMMHPAGTSRPRRFRSARVTLTSDITPPATMASVIGDTIELIDPTASTGYGWSYCTVAGSPGTWKGKGQAGP
ncbi:MAG: hypothetical protein ABIR92_10325, partial [Gemmatimonadaceae bacterium]